MRNTSDNRHSIFSAPTPELNQTGFHGDNPLRAIDDNFHNSTEHQKNINNISANSSTPTNSSAPTMLSAQLSQRPTRMHRQERRKQLLDVAADVFITKGYYQASMDDIAIQAGISKPVLYQHFPGKLELYLAVLTIHIDDLIASIRQALKSAKDVKTRIYTAVEAFFDYANRQGQVYKLIFRSDIAEPSVQQKISGAIEDCVDTVFDILSNDRGIDNYQTRMVAISLVGLSQVNAQYWLETHKQIDKNQAASITAAMVWGAYREVESVALTSSPTTKDCDSDD